MQSHRKLCLFCGCTLYEVSEEVVELFMMAVVAEGHRDGGKEFFVVRVLVWNQLKWNIKNSNGVKI